MTHVLLLALSLSTTHNTDPQLTRPTNNRASLGWLAASLSLASATGCVAVGAGLLAPKMDAYEKERARLDARGLTNDPNAQASLQQTANEVRDLQIATAVTAAAAGALGFVAIAMLVIWPGDKPSASAPVAWAPTVAPTAHGATAGVVGFF